MRALAETEQLARLAQLEGQLLQVQRLASLGKLEAASQEMIRVRQMLTAARGEARVEEPHREAGCRRSGSGLLRPGRARHAIGWRFVEQEPEQADGAYRPGEFAERDGLADVAVGTEVVSSSSSSDFGDGMHRGTSGDLDAFSPCYRLPRFLHFDPPSYQFTQLTISRPI